MEGAPLIPAIPPTDETSVFIRPKCSIGLEAILTEDQLKKEVSATIADLTDAALKVPSSYCRQECAERTGILCLARFRDYTEPIEELHDPAKGLETQSILTSEAIEELKQPHNVALLGRFVRTLDWSKPIKPIAGLDSEVMELFTKLGFPQTLALTTVVNPNEKPNNGAGHNIRNRLQEVKDPRPAAVRERELLEEEGVAEKREGCSRLLATAIDTRQEKITRWKKRNRNSGKPREEWSNFRDNDSKSLYYKAVEASEEADPLICENCLTREFCPLLNGVPPANFFEQTEAELHIGRTKFRTQPRIRNILKGLPWTRLLSPPSTADVIGGIIDQLSRLAEEAKENRGQH